MKFGDYLETHLVPEWRSQYLDYNRGKFKLKKITTFLGTSSECKCELNESANQAIRGSPPVLEESSQQNSDTHSVLYGKSKIAQLDYQLHNPFDVSCKSTQTHHETENGDDDFDGETNSDFKVTSLIERIHYEEEPRQDTPLLAKQKQRQRSHSTSILYMRGIKPVLTSENKDITALVKKQFMDWVDVELIKVETFYKNKETECCQRYIVLLDQLEKMSSQQLESTSQSRSTEDFQLHNGEKRSFLANFLSPFLSSVSISRRCQFILSFFDFPSFPSYFWHEDKDVTKTTDSEYQELLNIFGNSPPSLLMSKLMIKKALCELYHTLELLNSYRSMNEKAFRKLIKKFDKRCQESKLKQYMHKVKTMNFSKSDKISALSQSIENIYTYTFEDGHKKVAITKLRSFDSEKSHYGSNFLSGYLIGVSFPLLVIYVMRMYYRYQKEINLNDKYVLQLWGSWFLFVFAGLLFSVNCLVWDKFRINYKLVFELNPQDALNYKQFLLIPATLLFIACSMACYGIFVDPSNWITYESFPALYFYILLAVMFCPLNIFYLRARIWFIASTFRLFLSGFYPVEFRDFFMGVMSCSLTYSIANIYLMICLQNKHWENCLSCGPMKSHLLGAFACFPPLWRSFQCLRRFLDTGEWFPHFANLAKYLITTTYFLLLSFYRIKTFEDHFSGNENNSLSLNLNQTITIWFIFISVINSLYSSFWDIWMDWSLMQFDSENYLLRDVLIYKKKSIYYSAMIIDVILRFQWMVYVFTPFEISHSPLTAFGVAIAELLRRFMWMFFRMENEHASNVNLFRVARVCPIPYFTSIDSILLSQKLNNVSENIFGKKLCELFSKQCAFSYEDILTMEDNTDSFSRSNEEQSLSLGVDLEGFQVIGNESDLNEDVSSIYSTATHLTNRRTPASGWHALSRIVSRAHAKEFQQRNTKQIDRRNSIQDDFQMDQTDLS